MINPSDITAFLKITDKGAFNKWVPHYLNYWIDGCKKLGINIIINKHNSPIDTPADIETYTVDTRHQLNNYNKIYSLVENCDFIAPNCPEERIEIMRSMASTQALSIFAPKTKYSINIDADDARHWLDADVFLNYIIKSFDETNSNIFSCDVYYSRDPSVTHHWSFGVCMSNNEVIIPQVEKALTMQDHLPDDELKEFISFQETTKMSRNLDLLMDYYLNHYNKDRYLAYVMKFGDYIHDNLGGRCYRYDVDKNTLKELSYVLPRENSDENILHEYSLHPRTCVIPNIPIENWKDPFIKYKG